MSINLYSPSKVIFSDPSIPFKPRETVQVWFFFFFGNLILSRLNYLLKRSPFSFFFSLFSAQLLFTMSLFSWLGDF